MSRNSTRVTSFFYRSIPLRNPLHTTKVPKSMSAGALKLLKTSLPPRAERMRLCCSEARGGPPSEGRSQPRHLDSAAGTSTTKGNAAEMKTASKASAGICSCAMMRIIEACVCVREYAPLKSLLASSMSPCSHSIRADPGSGLFDRAYVEGCETLSK